jgi:hypothetical protein
LRGAGFSVTDSGFGVAALRALGVAFTGEFAACVSTAGAAVAFLVGVLALTGASALADALTFGAA